MSAHPSPSFHDFSGLPALLIKSFIADESAQFSLVWILGESTRLLFLLHVGDDLSAERVGVAEIAISSVNRARGTTAEWTRGNMFC